MAASTLLTRPARNVLSALQRDAGWVGVLILSMKYFCLVEDSSLPRQRRRQGNQGMCSSGQDKHKNHENYEIRVSRV